MEIKLHRKFKKKYLKLSPKLRRKVDYAIDKFEINPFDPMLRNHQLKGDMKDRRAFWVIGNCRVIFEEYGNYIIVIMLDVGGHSEVY